MLQIYVSIGTRSLTSAMEGMVRTQQGNAVMRQTCLLDTFVWFSRWKELHDDRVRLKLATEYNFFANKTWFCIKSLLLAHIAVIQIYCVMDNKSISPQTMNTDTVEWLFGDA